MEREIKFRGWDGNKMSQVSGYYTDGSPPIGIVCFDSIMQFTGLLDKNGKEIYEGDVVKSDVYATIQKEVVRWDYEHWHPFEYYHSCIEEDFEVIGNIHENPELLTN